MTNSPPVQAASAVERAKIIAWLRYDNDHGAWLIIDDRRLDDIADAIERGDHLASLKDTPDAG